MKISEDTYTTLTNTSTIGEVYDNFLGSLSYYKTKAINAAYDNGYLTEEEAKQLKEDGYAKRNVFTNIYISDTLDSITLYCLEHEDADSFSNINTLFKLSYDKMTGFLVNELNADIVN